ncbi:hypothetical protein ZIOFF_007460 [Zingiber officinale]|uniref:NADP-dependent oxidoreductase domain-containing protein n=1 Tax=Zingiber officinale TaxID=94328 RepID=A0A8J5I1P2_ZINOF|nr:hypothetical protein ZIOFF_007460 [Zingiber officinale]
MALQVCGAGFSLLPPLGRRAVIARAVAPESTTTKVEVEKVNLGGSEVRVTKIGIGAWSWGDTAYWNNFQWDDRKLKGAKAAFDASIDVGITFFDTAEVYGAGVMGAVSSELLLGRFIKERQQKDVEVAVATKFAALPWRLGRQSVISALKASLSRLDLASVELYQLHWPGIWGNEGYIDGLGDAVEQGLVKAVGVSNYSEKRLRDAYNQLKKRGIPLASNQVNYSLLYRLPEQNGVKATCDELGITLIAYSPIAQGIIQIYTILYVILLVCLYNELVACTYLKSTDACLYEFLECLVESGRLLALMVLLLKLNYDMNTLADTLNYHPGALTGKYTPENPPTGPRGRIYTPEYLRKASTCLQPLVTRLKEIGQNYGKTPTQVVLNWLIAQENTVPIPGAKNAEQATEFVGALGWRLTEQEIEELRSIASEMPSIVGFPVEKL